MPEIFVTDRCGVAHTAAASAGSALMETLRDLGLVDAVCGGGASCGTCLVRIDGTWIARLPAADSIERMMLDGLECTDRGDRLSCQITMHAELDGLSLTVLASDF